MTWRPRSGRPRWEWTPPEEDEALASRVKEVASEGVRGAYAIADKLARQARMGEVRDGAVAALSSDEDGGWSADQVLGAVSGLEKSVVRGKILAGEPRIDGRDPAAVRNIASRVGVLPTDSRLGIVHPR